MVEAAEMDRGHVQQTEYGQRVVTGGFVFVNEYGT